MTADYRSSLYSNRSVLAGVTTTDPYWPGTNFFANMIGLNAREDDFLKRLANPAAVLRDRVAVLSRVSPTRPNAAPSRILLDGNPSLLFEYSTTVPGNLYGVAGEIDVALAEVLVAFGRQEIVLTFSGQAGLYSNMLPAFWTFLGTWRWEGYGNVSETFHFHGQTTFVNKPVNTVIRDFQNTYKSSQVRDQLSQLLNLILASQHLRDEEKESTALLVHEIAAASEQPANRGRAREKLAALGDKLSKVAGIAAPALEIIASLHELIK